MDTAVQLACSTHTLTAGLCALVLVLIWITVSHHSKRNLPPGPWTFPIIGSLYVLMYNKGNVLKTFRDLRSRYGDIFSLKLGSSDLVVINGYDNMKELFSKRGDEVSDRPDSFIFSELSFRKGLIGSSGSLWKTHRTFALTTLRGFGFGKRSIEDRIREEVAIFLQELEGYNSQPFDLDDIVQKSVSNIINSIVFGQRFDYTDERFIKFLKAVNDNLRLVGPGALISIFPILRYFPGDLFKGNSILRNRDNCIALLREQIRQHVQTFDETNIRDYIDAFYNEQIQNRDTFSDLQLVMTVGDLFVGGTETTSTAIKWAVLFFLYHPEVQHKMRLEIDDVIGTSRRPTLDDRVNLPYCEAVVTEVLRCGNIVPLSVQHSCQEDVNFNGFTIPKGAIIVPNLDSVLKDSAVFEDPDTFNPERYIDDIGKFTASEKVVAFSVGRRVCLGESLARSELFLYLTAMVQCFSFVTKDKNNLPGTSVGVLGVTHSPHSYHVCAVKRE